MTPTVVAVSLSPAHGFSKQPQPVIRLIAGEGVEGDAHRGRTTQHLYRKRQDPTQPNFCQVHLLAQEKLAALAEKGFPVSAGELGENILTDGLDLHSLPTGALLRIGPEAELEITGERTPCSQIDGLLPGLQQHCWGDRNASGKRARHAGVMAIVLAGGEVRPGDQIIATLPPPPHHALRPV